ncbi:CRISPR-associated protein Csx16 [Caldimonas tepidiphila]|uniref:CRISPR-associated protein Csx16 n=1 Tax=Caldimonas tepidiphila TaxID=2315841 RepID=UPI00196AEBB0|nr:CRISPR-associated protein Csx16 [Caldimonas tepidiphila]
MKNESLREDRLMSSPASPRLETRAPVTWMVTRHPGALQWLHEQGLQGRCVPHLDPQQVDSGDRVIGTLPLHMVAAICERGARYFHLSLDLPPELRGKELTAAQLEACGARLEAFMVLACEDDSLMPSQLAGDRNA